MPRLAAELSAVDVKRLKHPGGGRGNVTFAVGGVAGLLLQVVPTGGRTWLLRTVVGDRRREIGLGGYPTVTLAMARQRAREALDATRKGVDPVEERKAAKAALAAARSRGLTFKDAVRKFGEAKLGGHKDKDRWLASLDIHAVPTLGDMIVSDIAAQDVLRVLEPIWTSKPEIATKVRSRLESVLSWATVAGHRTGDNPARWRGNLKELLPKPAAGGDRQSALSLADAPAWFAELRKREGTGSRAVEFLTLTAARSGEVRGATWGEIDLDAGLWIVPAARMKAGAEHRVPLPPAAVSLLRALPRLDEGSNQLVFPAPRGGQLSDMTLSATMRRMHEAEVEAGRKGWLDSRSGRPAVPHGLRSTFRDWAAERGHDRDMAEIALAHTGRLGRGARLSSERHAGPPPDHVGRMGAVPRGRGRGEGGGAAGVSDAGKLVRPGLTESDIAEVLRGEPSPRFLRVLATMLDPPPGVQPVYRLTHSRVREGRPKGAGNRALGAAMLDAIEGLPRGQAKVAKATVAERFGVTLRWAEASMAEERDRRLAESALDEGN